MHLPATIPAGARLVVRIALGADPEDGRPKFRDYVGHVVDWDCLLYTSDAADE